ncbi:MAG: hypothetical protein HKUEN02_18980 [Anaerolineaceae bacterium]|nr:MAG: hypothetical protein HKUEN02_18980 [Anaerolineaceae bacterium]
MKGTARREGKEEQGAELEGVGVLVNREGFCHGLARIENEKDVSKTQTDKDKMGRK